MKNIIAGNWKMNNLKKDIDIFFKEFNLKKSSINYQNREILIAPPSLYIEYIKREIEKYKINCKIGAQNCFYEHKGAFTGEISFEMLSDIGVDFVIIGHSERRYIFNESDQLISEKVSALLNNNIITIFCIGETLSERENGQTFHVLERQLSSSLKKSLNTNLLIIAYEPVWAIGTGKTASINQISDVHNWLTNYLQKNIANNIPLLYGGSVKSSNIKEIMSIDNVNGVLVGGASLDFTEFIQIINFDKEFS